MNPLEELYHDKLFGSIHGLDRVRFRGTLRWIANTHGVKTFLSRTGRLLKDFGAWAEGLTKDVRTSCEQRASELRIPAEYLASSSGNKEALARAIAADHNKQDGSICMFSVVEPCWAPIVRGNRQKKMLELTMGPRKCIWIYHYFDHPDVGFGHVRIQTWLPFTVQICLNGRHWLEKQLRKKGVAYTKDGNCFPWLENIATAQALMDEQLRTNWPQLLDGLLFHACPAIGSVLHPLRPDYYWSADETEYATDYMFRSPDELAKLYPALIHHGITVADSPAVMRFLGHRKLTDSGKTAGRIPNEVRSDFRKRAEGMRLKHWVNANSVKMYDKSGSILRIETTINNTRDFKVFRRPDDNPQRSPSWQKLRKGVSDLHRRCEVSHQCNQRYAEAMSTVQVEDTLKEIVTDACNPVIKQGKRCRGLNPWHKDDYQILTFLARGEWAINGFRNKDLRVHLFPQVDASDLVQQKRLSGKISRRIRMLRMHGLIRKVPRVNRYVLTAAGKKFSAALLSASSASSKRLMESAA